MSNTFVTLAIPDAPGVAGGTLINSEGPVTFALSGRGFASRPDRLPVGTYSIETSANDAEYATLVQLTPGEPVTFDKIAMAFARVRLSGMGAAEQAVVTAGFVDPSSEASFVALEVPFPGSGGVGAPVDLPEDALPQKILSYSGNFDGALALEGSNDGGGSWFVIQGIEGVPSPAPTPSETRTLNLYVVAEKVRLVRSGVAGGGTGFFKLSVIVDPSESGAGDSIAESLANGDSVPVPAGSLVRIKPGVDLNFVRARANTFADAVGTIGALNEATAVGELGLVTTDGRAVVLLEDSLSGVAAGQQIWLSTDVLGRGTNVRTGDPDAVLVPLGIIKDASTYEDDSTVVADIEVEPNIGGAGVFGTSPLVLSAYADQQPAHVASQADAGMGRPYALAAEFAVDFAQLGEAFDLNLTGIAQMAATVNSGAPGQVAVFVGLNPGTLVGNTNVLQADCTSPAAGTIVAMDTDVARPTTAVGVIQFAVRRGLNPAQDATVDISAWSLVLTVTPALS